MAALDSGSGSGGEAERTLCSRTRAELRAASWEDERGLAPTSGRAFKTSLDTRETGASDGV